MKCNFPCLQIESFDKNDDGEIELSEMAKYVQSVLYWSLEKFVHCQN